MSVRYIISQGGSGTPMKPKLKKEFPLRYCGTSHNYLDFRECSKA